jgi:hypothetical protein
MGSEDTFKAPLQHHQTRHTPATPLSLGHGDLFPGRPVVLPLAETPQMEVVTIKSTKC